MNKKSTTTPKVKKADKALEIFRRHLPTRDTMDRHAFRAAVISDFKREMKVTNTGTLGMYFSWADKQVTGRQTKQYNRTAGRNNTKEKVDENGKTEAQNLNTLAATVFRQTAKIARDQAERELAKNPPKAKVAPPAVEAPEAAPEVNG